MYLVAVAYHLPRHDLCCWHIGNWLYSKFGVAYADTVIDAVANEVMHSPRKRWRADDIARELRVTIAGGIAIRATTEAGHPNHAEELDSAATKLGRLTGRVC
jgi:hypothetical protein